MSAITRQILVTSIAQSVSNSRNGTFSNANAGNVFQQMKQLSRCKPELLERFKANVAHFMITMSMYFACM